MNANGDLIKQMPFFEEALDSVEWTGGKLFESSEIVKKSDEIDYEFANPILFDPEWNIKGIYDALITGIQEYFR